MKGNGPDRIDVALRDGVLLCTAHGFVTRDIQLQTYRAIDASLQEGRAAVSLLWDASDIDGFEPGLPMAMTKFLVTRIRRFNLSAVVARNPTIAAVARAARMFVPSIPYGVFASHDEAWAFLRARATHQAPPDGPASWP